jgi:hypothetical protein
MQEKPATPFYHSKELQARENDGGRTKIDCALLLLSTVFFQPGLRAQSNDAATLASGTLNLVIANKIVVAADSRMSSDAPFPCGRALTLHYDNSQKLFRTGSRSAIRSAMVIAGFAVGRWGSPLDLSLASLLRNRFGVDGRREPEGGVRDVEEWARYKLDQLLTDVAAVSNHGECNGNLLLIAMFAGLLAMDSQSLRSPCSKRAVFPRVRFRCLPRAMTSNRPSRL